MAAAAEYVRDAIHVDVAFRPQADAEAVRRDLLEERDGLNVLHGERNVDQAVGVFVRGAGLLRAVPASASASAARPPPSNSRLCRTAPISRSRPIVLLSYTARAIASGCAPASVQRRQISNVRGVMCEK